MDLKLTFPQQHINATVAISGSKSESNRLLILQQLYPNLIIENISTSDDTRVIQEILAASSTVADVHHAGTAMRFLTALFASTDGKNITLQGSERMHQRPIGILVEALRDLGADISYLNEQGYPPLKIKGKPLTNNHVSIQGAVSSQYISALLLIAPKLKNGLNVQLVGEVTSAPYIHMTLKLLNQLGITADFTDTIINVKPQPTIKNQTIVVESDWSSASYWYGLIALSTVGSKIRLSAFKKDSLQGDSCLSDIYKTFGVATAFSKNSILIEKCATANVPLLTLDLKNTPDIAQTIAVTCLGLGITCHLKGLHTLQIKETNRLVALQKELQKLGALVQIERDSLHLSPLNKITTNVSITTYQDHRMAMAFAPLALKVPITILNAEVVSKSYPNFWTDFKAIGGTIATNA